MEQYLKIRDITYMSELTPPSKPNALSGGLNGRFSPIMQLVFDGCIEGGVQFAQQTYVLLTIL
jgi:hypothetical protein